MTNATFFRRHRVAPSAYFDKTNSLSLSKFFFRPKKWRQNLKFKSLAAFLGHFVISKPRTINVDYTSVGTRIHGLLVTSSSYSWHDLNWSSILFCPPMVLVVLLGNALPEMNTYSIPPLGTRSAHYVTLGLLASNQHWYPSTWQQYQEILSGLPSKYCSGLMLLSFNVRIGSGEFNMAWPLARGFHTSVTFAFSILKYFSFSIFSVVLSSGHHH